MVQEDSRKFLVFESHSQNSSHLVLRPLPSEGRYDIFHDGFDFHVAHVEACGKEFLQLIHPGNKEGQHPIRIANLWIVFFENGAVFDHDFIMTAVCGGCAGNVNRSRGTCSFNLPFTSRRIRCCGHVVKIQPSKNCQNQSDKRSSHHRSLFWWKFRPGENQWLFGSIHNFLLWRKKLDNRGNDIGFCQLWLMCYVRQFLDHLFDDVRYGFCLAWAFFGSVNGRAFHHLEPVG